MRMKVMQTKVTNIIKLSFTDGSASVTVIYSIKYMMCPPLSFDHLNIEINNIDQPSLYTRLFIREQLGYRLYCHQN